MLVSYVFQLRGLEMWLDGMNVCLAHARPRFNRQHCISQVWCFRICHLRSEVQGHSWLHSDFEASLNYMRPYLKEKKNIKVEQGHKHTASCEEYKWHIWEDTHLHVKIPAWVEPLSSIHKAQSDSPSTRVRTPNPSVAGTPFFFTDLHRDLRCTWWRRIREMGTRKWNWKPRQLCG